MRRAEIESFIRSLEEERRKIEVFRREIQLCVRLLADGEKWSPVVLSCTPSFLRTRALWSLFSAPSSLTRWCVRRGLQ